MEVSYCIPQNDVLKKYIECYYFFKAGKESGPINYRTFPNNFCILSVNLNSSSSLVDNKIMVVPSKDQSVSSSLVCRYIKPIEISIVPPINEITIYFKPLGLNHFADDLPAFLKQKNNYEFSPFPDFKEAMKILFNEDAVPKQAALLEKYWISKLNNKDFTLLYSILSDINEGIPVESIARKHNYTRQYILKLFQTHTGKTLTEYKKIQRFKNMLRKKGKDTHLTGLAYSNDYYDQSHFIRDFKGLTNLKPTTFFKNVDVEKPSIWHFIG